MCVLFVYIRFDSFHMLFDAFHMRFDASYMRLNLVLARLLILGFGVLFYIVAKLVKKSDSVLRILASGKYDISMDLGIWPSGIYGFYTSMYIYIYIYILYIVLMCFISVLLHVYCFVATL